MERKDIILAQLEVNLDGALDFHFGERGSVLIRFVRLCSVSPLEHLGRVILFHAIWLPILIHCALNI